MNCKVRNPDEGIWWRTKKHDNIRTMWFTKTAQSEANDEIALLKMKFEKALEELSYKVYGT